MPKTILIVGYGPGVSTAMADRFAAAGFAVALAARSPDRLAAGVERLKSRGVAAAGIVADAADPDSLVAAINAARAALGPITVLHWNAFSGRAVDDLISAKPMAIKDVFDIAVVGLLTAVQTALPDLKAAGDGAVLVTNGAYGENDAMMDAFATSVKAVGVGLANAAKHKLVGLLSARLAGEGVYVGEVTIAGAVRGTPSDSGNAIDPAVIAEAFWTLYQGRGVIRARVA